MDYVSRFDSDERDECTYVEGKGFDDPSLRHPPRNLIRIYASAVALALISFLALEQIIPVAVFLLFRGINPAIRVFNNSFLASEEVLLCSDILSAVLCYLPPVLILLSLLRIPMRVAFSRMRTGAGTVLPCTGIVLCSSAIGSTLSALLGALLAQAGLHPAAPVRPVPTSAVLLLLSILSSALLPALFEEALFRGVMLQSLRRFGELFALVTSTLLFALLHRNMVQLPNALLTGAVLGYITLRTGSLFVAMICHFVNNLIPIVLQSFTAALPNAAAGTVYLLLNIFYVLCGLAGLLFVCMRRSHLLGVPRRDARPVERKKYASFFSSVPLLILLIWLCVTNLANMLL